MTMTEGVALIYGRRYKLWYRTGLRHRLREAVADYYGTDDIGQLRWHCTSTGQTVTVRVERLERTHEVARDTPTFLDRLVEEPEEP